MSEGTSITLQPSRGSLEWFETPEGQAAVAEGVAKTLIEESAAICPLGFGLPYSVIMHAIRLKKNGLIRILAILRGKRSNPYLAIYEARRGLAHLSKITGANKSLSPGEQSLQLSHLDAVADITIKEVERDRVTAIRRDDTRRRNFLYIMKMSSESYRIDMAPLIRTQQVLADYDYMLYMTVWNKTEMERRISEGVWSQLEENASMVAAIGPAILFLDELHAKVASAYLQEAHRHDREARAFLFKDHEARLPQFERRLLPENEQLVAPIQLSLPEPAPSILSPTQKRAAKWIVDQGKPVKAVQIQKAMGRKSDKSVSRDLISPLRKYWGLIHVEGGFVFQPDSKIYKLLGCATPPTTSNG